PGALEVGDRRRDIDGGARADLGRDIGWGSGVARKLFERQVELEDAAADAVVLFDPLAELGRKRARWRQLEERALWVGVGEHRAGAYGLSALKHHTGSGAALDQHLADRGRGADLDAQVARGRRQRL